jgi:hypothetical protein
MNRLLVAFFNSLSSVLLELECGLAARSLGLCPRLYDQLRLWHVGNVGHVLETCLHTSLSVCVCVCVFL